VVVGTPLMDILCRKEKLSPVWRKGLTRQMRSRRIGKPKKNHVLIMCVLLIPFQLIRSFTFIQTTDGSLSKIHRRGSTPPLTAKERERSIRDIGGGDAKGRDGKMEEAMQYLRRS
jgi:hypothetical protein